MPDKNDKNDNDNGNNEDGNQEAVTWDTFMGAQTEEVQGLYQSNIEGLKSTIKATRSERDTMANELRDAAGELEKGSDAEGKLLDMAGKVEAAEKRATFAEDALKPEIGCTNPKVAYLVALAGDLFDRRGNPDWDAIKKASPETFKEKLPKVDGGEGTDKIPTGKGDMNTFIRSRAGRS